MVKPPNIPKKHWAIKHMEAIMAEAPELSPLAELCKDEFCRSHGLFVLRAHEVRKRGTSPGDVASGVLSWIPKVTFTAKSLDQRPSGIEIFQAAFELCRYYDFLAAQRERGDWVCSPQD